MVPMDLVLIITLSFEIFITFIKQLVNTVFINLDNLLNMKV